MGIVNRYLGNESIDFQTDNFKDKIVEEVNQLNILSAKMFMDNDLLVTTHNKIESLIRLRTGLKVKLKVVSFTNAAAQPVFFNQYNILHEIDDKFKLDVHVANQRANKLKNKKGYINLKKAKVSGIFSEFESYIYYNLSLFRKYKLTPEEATAIFLHELGHIFTYYEYSDRLEKTNQVLLDISTRLNKDKKKDLDEYVIQTLNKNDIKVEPSDDRNVLASNLIEGVYKHVESQLENSIYTKTSSEQLADNFATRFGLGRELVSALDKIYSKNWQPEKSGFIWHYLIFRRVLQILWIVGKIIISLNFKNIFGFFRNIKLFITLAIRLVFNNSGTHYKNWDYDTLVYRYQRIRNQLVEQLKYTDDSEDLKTMIKDIESVDKMIETTYDRETLMFKFFDLILPKNRVTNRDIKLQQMLENLSSNDLFIQAKKLKIITE